MNNFADMKTAFIGIGNMGGATVRGLIGKGILRAEDVSCCDINTATLERLAQDCPGIKTTSDSREAARGADCIVLAVKPWLVEQVIGQIKDLLDLKRQNLVVIAAGVTFENISSVISSP